MEDSHTTCQFCNAIIRTTGMRQHLRTQTCKAKQEFKSIPSTWEPLPYEIRARIYALNLAFHHEDAGKLDSPHVKLYAHHFRKPGWGKRGHTQKGYHIHSGLNAILRSSILSDKEKHACLKADADSLEFTTAYATAMLAGG